MNMMALLLNQSLPTTYPNQNSNETQVSNKSESPFFQHLLSAEQDSEEMVLHAELNDRDHIKMGELYSLPVEKLKILYSFLSEHTELVNEVSEEELLTKLGDLSDDELKELYNLLNAPTELADKISDEEINKSLISFIHNLFNDHNELSIHSWSQMEGAFKNNERPNQELPIANFVNSSLDNSPKIVQPNQVQMEKQFNEIFAQVELLLAKVTDEQDLIRISPRMLELLEKWTALANKYSSEKNQNYSLQTLNVTDSSSGTREQGIWKELVSTFQKRNELASNQHYYGNANVTTKDISKWLQSILSAQVNVEDNAITQSINLSNQPLSKMEQYVIYVNQSGVTQSVEKQLIEQFQQVMSTSRFLSLNNGVNQLSIALRPDNLGEMMVRFTEINGEMTLKIIVSSQATRQILETNIHQLKNMFSPHQVVIEEREVMIDNVQNQSEEQAFDEEEDHYDESNQDESRNFDGEPETQFHEILMNEKV